MTLEPHICRIIFVKLPCRYQASGLSEALQRWSGHWPKAVKQPRNRTNHGRFFSTSLVATCHPLAVGYYTEVLECEVCEGHQHLYITADH